MEILFEIIVELIAELATGDYSIDSRNTLPKPIKIIVTILFLAIYIGLIVIIGWGAITCWNKGEYEMFAVLLVVDILVAVIVVCTLVKKYKKNIKKR